MLITNAVVGMKIIPSKLDPSKFARRATKFLFSALNRKGQLDCKIIIGLSSDAMKIFDR